MEPVIHDSQSEIQIFSDGASRGNPGPAASAFVVQDSQGHTLHQAGKYLGQTTNNVAEYTAALLALQWLSDKYLKTHNSRLKSVKYFLDSELLVKQLTGQYKIKSPHLKTLVIQIIKLVSYLRSRGVVVNFSHVKRHHNQDADLLANQILDQHLE